MSHRTGNVDANMWPAVYCDHTPVCCVMRLNEAHITCVKLLHLEVLMTGIVELEKSHGLDPVVSSLH